LENKKIYKNNKIEAIKALIINKKLNNESNNNYKINKNSRNNITEISTLKTNNYSSETKNNCNSKSQDEKFRTLKNEKNKKIFFKSAKKISLQHKIKAEKILNEILSLKTKKELKSYFKKDECSEDCEESKKKENKIKLEIDPMYMIKYKFLNESKNKNIFSSFNTQVMIMGSRKNRNDFFDGINSYKSNIVKYEDLRGPTGFDKNRIEEMKRNSILQKMKMNYCGKKGFSFGNKLYIKRYNKKFSEIELDSKYQNIKKFIHKNIEKYENSNYKVKRSYADLDRNDIKLLNTIDNNAEFAIHNRDEMLQFSRKFLSFDTKLDDILSKTRNTIDYLLVRAQEHKKIKNKIEQYFNKNREEL
jgi:hypothetical protein